MAWAVIALLIERVLPMGMSPRMTLATVSPRFGTAQASEMVLRPPTTPANVVLQRRKMQVAAASSVNGLNLLRAKRLLDHLLCIQ